MAETKEPFLAELPRMKLNPDREPNRIIRTVKGKFTQNLVPGECIFSVPHGRVLIEDFLAGDTVEWDFPFSELHCILKGKAKLTYSLPPFHQEKKEMIVEGGDWYMIPIGARMRWEVEPGEPLRHVCVIMPNYATLEERMTHTEPY